MNYQRVWLRAGIKTIIAPDATGTAVFNRIIAASVQYRAYLQDFLGAGQYTAPAGFAFQSVNLRIRLASVNVHNSAELLGWEKKYCNISLKKYK